MEAKDAILRSINDQQITQFAQEIARIPSFGGEEQQMAKFLGERMRAMGMKVEYQEVEPGRIQPVGRWKGKGGGPSLIFNGHMDHNPVVEGWKKDPFGGEIEGGYLYGTGVVNMKAGNCAMIAATEALIRSGLNIQGEIIITLVVGELQCGLGTLHNLKQGITADYAIVTEPTDMNLYTFHTGGLQMKIHVIGATRHFSTRKDKGVGIHAIKKMMKVIDALSEGGDFMEPIKPGGWLTWGKYRPEYDGLPQVNVGTIEAGLSRKCHKWRGGAIMPDFCTIDVDVRFIPSQTPESVEKDIRSLLESIKSQDPEFQYEMERNPHFRVMPVYWEDPKARIVQALGDSFQEVMGKGMVINPSVWKSDIWVQFYGSDAAHLKEAGIETALFGPGGGSLTTGAERVKVQDIINATKMYALTAAKVIGVEK